MVTPLPISAPRPRVLIVDDDATIGKALHRLLRRTHDVELASDGQEALAAIRGGQRFNAIVSDVAMPLMTGIELFEHLAREVPEQARHFVFLTGGVQGPVARKLRQTGAPQLEKPVDISALRDTIAQLADST
ncbi:MAG: response regulator [Myxococcales bacterium]|nr:response regulator [Myxococcales bacterium]HRC57246.1 response regulator [Kofleriaceae bacterium]